MPPIIAFVGWHNSGKTTLARRVLTCLKERGYLVAVVKSTKESGLCPERPQSDTALYWESGADYVGLLGPDQIVVRSRKNLDLHTLAELLFNTMDLVIAEGFKHVDRIPKIEVRRNAAPLFLSDQMAEVIAVVTEDKHQEKLPCFHFEQFKELADFIEENIILPGKGSQAE